MTEEKKKWRDGLITMAEYKKSRGQKFDKNDYKKLVNTNRDKKNSRIQCYYWVDARTGKRVSWNFPSRKEAIKWRDMKCSRYVHYNSLEHYLDEVLVIKRKREAEYWAKDKEKFLNWGLRRGVFDTEPRYFWYYEVDKDGNLV